MPVHCYEQSWYKYRIHIGTRVLICMNLRDRVVYGGGCFDTHTRWTKVHLSMTRDGPNQKI